MTMRNDVSRREFIKRSAMVSAAATLPTGIFALGQEQIKVGVIGVGGRGAGAAVDCFNADKSVVIWSVGDLFEDRLNSSLNWIKGETKERCQVTKDRTFVGFDAYKGVLASGCDVVILTAPPGFRPVHFEAAVAAGKHVFMEKPVATDAAGIRMVLASAQLAKQKKLTVVAGTQRRHDLAYRECMKRIHGGEMGDVMAMYAYWNQGGLWMHPRQPNWSDMEWQLRNWLYFTWLSGDHIVEQHVHNIDVCNWAMQAHPVKAFALGGRQCRVDPAYGHVFDHFTTEYEYANGVRMISMCRQIDGTSNRVAEHIVGSKGTSNANTSIKGAKAWRWDGERPNPYVLEHKNMIASIRKGEAFNEAQQVAESTLTAIMGRMAAYTGQEITWEQALNSTERLVPESFGFGALPVPPVAMPGTTKFM